MFNQTQNNRNYPNFEDTKKKYSNFKFNKNEQHSGTKRDNFIGEEVDYVIKKEIINHIYLNIDIYHIRCCLLKSIEYVDQLKQQTYYITPHFQGYNYLLVFKKINNDVNAFIVYRMDLKFEQKDVDINTIKIYKLNIKRSINEYDNTIFDGKLIYKKNEKNC